MNGKLTAADTITEKPIASPIPIVEQESEEPRKRIPLASIPVTILIGLLIAALYLGGRILTARRVQRPPAAIHSATPAPPPVQPVAKAVAQPVQPDAKPASAVTPPSNSGDDTLPLIEPHSGERYIQVGALNPDTKDTRQFVERLRREGFDPHVAEGPAPELMRVLIGPFTNDGALNEKKAQIESEGIDTFVREY